MTMGQDHPSEMPPGEQLQDAASGARWGVGLFVIARGLALVTRALLYRIDAKVLGSYVVITEIIASSAYQFLVPGGSAALIKFMPTLPQEKRKRFLAGYSAIAAVLTLFAVVVLQATSAPLRWLLQSDIRSAPIGALTRYMIFLLPLVAAQSVGVFALMAQGKTVAGAKALNSVQIIIFFAAVLLFAFPAFTISHVWPLVTGCVAIAYLLTFVWAAWRIRDLYFGEGSRGSVAPLIPKGFVRFASISHFGFVPMWTAETLDQVLVCRYMGRADLGRYGACLTIARTVRWIPIIVTNQLLPLLSQLAASNRLDEMRRLHKRLTLYNVVCSLSIGIVCIVLGPQVLRLFGKDVGAYSGVLAVFAATFTMPAVSVVNTTSLLALGRADLSIAVGILATAAEIAYAVALGGNVSAIQIALMRTVYLFVEFSVSIAFVWFLYSFGPSAKELKALASGFLSWLVFFLLHRMGGVDQVWAAGVSLVLYPVLLTKVLKALDRGDWEFALDHIIPKRLSRAFKKGGGGSEDWE
jgi:O-antigen/teichoic acid export membrane protein